VATNTQLPEATDKRVRALAHLRSLEKILARRDVPHAVPSTHVDTYHQALDHLEQCGEDVREFRFPMNEVHEKRESPGETYIDRGRLYVKAVTLIDYFAIRQALLERADQLKADPASLIGFQPPQH